MLRRAILGAQQGIANCVTTMLARDDAATGSSRCRSAHVAALRRCRYAWLARLRLADTRELGHAVTGQDAFARAAIGEPLSTCRW